VELFVYLVEGSDKTRNE